MRKVYFHTSFASPYRRHLFEALSDAIPGCVFFFTVKHEADRPWEDDSQSWQVESKLVAQSGELKTLLCQKWGTVHVLAVTTSRLSLICYLISGFIRHSKLILWDDGGFVENAIRRRNMWQQILHWLRLRSYIGVFTPGKIGRNYALARDFDARKIVNAYFSHDVDAFSRYRISHGKDSRLRIRRQLGIDDNKICLLNISRYLDWKRLVDLAAALLIVEEKNPSFAMGCELVLIGDGECQDHLPMLERLKIIKVHLIKQMPANQVLAYYCAADLFVFPSEGDIWGLVVNEALSLGVPVVCTDRIGAAELIEDGVNGCKIPVRSPLVLAKKIIEFGNNRSLLLRMKNNAPRVCDRWNSKMAVASLKDFLERC